jgi:Tfp pilus assembly PilM family ATPase
MLRFLAKKPVLGIEITASQIRLAALSGRGENRSVLFTKAVELPGGMVNESYLTPNIGDVGQFADMLREALTGVSAPPVRRAALSLPDGVFRVQTLDFDELPSKPADRERLIRWRLEKSGFDVSDTVLQYQVLCQQDKGFSVLACLAKRSVLSQYEDVLAKAGLEPWSVGLASFHTLNFYSSYLSKASPVSALARVSEGSFTTLIMKAENVRFYRYKEVKQGNAKDSKARLMRELGDSLHFYSHRDRSGQTEIGRLYLTGDAALSQELVEGLKAVTSLEVEALSPAVIFPSAGEAGPELAAALGAGCGL